MHQKQNVENNLYVCGAVCACSSSRASAVTAHTTTGRAERLLPTTEPAITVTCVLYDGMNHYHCSMKEHNLALSQLFPYGP